MVCSDGVRISLFLLMETVTVVTETLSLDWNEVGNNLDQWFSNHSSWTSSISIWELVKNVNSGHFLQTYWIRHSGGKTSQSELHHVLHTRIWGTVIQNILLATEEFSPPDYLYMWFKYIKCPYPIWAQTFNLL